MPHIFKAKSFVADASALSDAQTDGRGNKGVSGLLEDYLEAQDTGGVAVDIDEIISISSCKLKGDRVFVLTVIEDQVAGG